MDFLEKAEGFNNFHEKEFNNYIDSLFEQFDSSKLTKEYYQHVNDLYNQQEDESYLNIDNWNQVRDEDK